MTPYNKVLQFSNYYYNEGLEKARVRDLSGAIESLKKSLKCNKKNIDARNLLGLCYFEIGECVLALKEWVLSTNLKQDDNIAAEYIQDVQPDIARTGHLNVGIKKYNQALEYANADKDDLAIIQLRKVVSECPKYLKALQLLALLYMRNGQYNQAREILKKAIKVDVNNTVTLLYLKEVNEYMRARAEKRGKKHLPDDSVSYTSGNDTIIRPAYFKDNSTFTAIINIMFGLGMGILIFLFLIGPGVKRRAIADSASKLVEANNSLTTKNATINELSAQVDELSSKLKNEQDDNTKSSASKEFYRNILSMYANYSKGDIVAAGEALAKIDEDRIDKDFKDVYEQLKLDINDDYCKILYQEASYNYNQGNYEPAVESFLKIIDLNETYKNGYALYFLAESYRKLQDNQKAITYYQRVLDACPDSSKAANAKRHLEQLN